MKPAALLPCALPRVLVLPGVLVFGLALASCGGSSADAAGAAKSAYVQQAAQVCREAEAAKLKAGAATPTRTQDIAPYVDALVAVAKEAAAKLRAVVPPAADRAALTTRLLDPLDAQVTEGQAFAAKVRAAGTDDAKVLALLADKPGAGKIDVQFVKDYGLDACVKAAQA